MASWSNIDAFFEYVESPILGIRHDIGDDDLEDMFHSVESDPIPRRRKNKKKRKKQGNDEKQRKIMLRSKGTNASGEHVVTRAVCMLHPDGDSGVDGRVIFESQRGGTKITAHVRGLTPGKHGFHIHELGDLSEGCKTAKGHFNPFAQTHGGPMDAIRHVGDLGNITANAEGVAIIEMFDHLVELNGEQSVIGRSVVVHAGTDDLGKGGHDDSLTTGHAGGRVACGVIGIGN